MGFTAPKGWDKESETLFIHDSGTRIEKRAYREKEGWFIIPVDLDQEVVGYDPTPEGRDKAFQDFAEGKIKTARKPKKAAEPEGPPKPKRGRKPKERLPAEEGEEGAEPGVPPPAEAEGEEAADKDKEDKEDKDEDEDEDEGDEA
ncbi:MAG TPA: hypothetical protein VF950_07555 [Planctomycetota bacterium]